MRLHRSETAQWRILYPLADTHRTAPPAAPHNYHQRIHCMKRTVIGILAHVDAGKTTLSEAMLYTGGAIRSMGRVDHGSAFLDTFALERQRGITIFSKQAVLNLDGLQATLLDTPGHVDFSAEMERTLSVLDCAILVISGPAGIQSHTMTVWKLLRARNIPTFIFVNKMDLAGAEREEAMLRLRRDFGDGAVDIMRADNETVAMASEELLEEYLENGTLSEASLKAAFREGRLYPCWFGAALRLEGVEDFLRGIARFAPAAEGGEGAESRPFGAKVYKISRDEQGTRLTHLKVTGGVLRVRDTLSGPDWTEKVTQLRVYSGAKFRAVDEALPGDVVAAVGLSRTAPGLGLGTEEEAAPPSLEPVLTYKVGLPEGFDAHKALGFFRQLEEEDPMLRVDWNEHLQEIRVQLMGAVQLEILSQLLRDRFALEVTFGQGSILYRETIAAPVEGVGHYEPLRHYAEVHLLIEPAPRGSGLRIATACSEDKLARNWQRLILTHIGEKQHLGVLTGSPLTDVTVSLMSGRAHIKHTEGGDFRQATYRAIRQGLMQAESILLEPWYEFSLTVPNGVVGRALMDMQRMGARFDPPEPAGDSSIIRGSAPVAAMGDYPQEVTAYTHGLGRFSCALKGYEPCQNQDEAVAAAGYDPEADLDNPPDSVFCSHGAGFTVKWEEVPKYMHLPSCLEPEEEEEEPYVPPTNRRGSITATDKELMQIFERTYGPVKQPAPQAHRSAARPKIETRPYRASARPKGPEYVLVDGYNIIFAWDELKKMAAESLDLARTQLIERLRNYQGYIQGPVIVVFDAYKVKGGVGSVERMGGLSVVYTKEAETADMYIEKVTRQLGRDHRVRVATSDNVEQMIILGNNCLRLSADGFLKEVRAAEAGIQDILRKQR